MGRGLLFRAMRFPVRILWVGLVRGAFDGGWVDGWERWFSGSQRWVAGGSRAALCYRPALGLVGG